MSPSAYSAPAAIVGDDNLCVSRGCIVVSAITQTPASGPFALLTTPPRSLLPTLTAAGLRCCALAPTSIPAVAKAAINIEATMRGRPTNVRIFMVF